MKFVGHNPKSGLIEILELKNHKWFIGVQFHPEYKKYSDKSTPFI